MKIDGNTILGHERQLQQLQDMLAANRLPHALLFSGADGVGKKLAAKAIAKAILCGDAVDGVPCGQCESCKAFQAGSHPDYDEVLPEIRGKGTKTIRIEQIREMQTIASRYPILSKRRVVLLDEVEYMNEAAENSLLKTLEEPEGEVVFILVTSAPANLLDTIRSRCMLVSFGVLSEENLKLLLNRHQVPQALQEELAFLSDGSIGRALQLYAGDGMARDADALHFLESLSTMDMEILWKQAKTKGEWERELLIEWFLYLNMLLRDLLVLYEDGASNLLYHKEKRSELAGLIGKFSKAQVFAMLSEVREMQRRLQKNVNLRLQMEGFFLRMRDFR